jgi:seryl-tRNA synthetase
MLDPRFVEENAELVKDHLRRRHADPELAAAIDRVAAMAADRRDRIAQRDELRGRRNSLSKQIGKLMREGRGDEAQAAKEEVQAGNTRIAELEAELAQMELDRDDVLQAIPNLIHDDVPEGESDEDNPVLRTWGTPATYDFEPLPHVEVGQNLGMLDLERAAKLSGARFAVLTGGLARMERALVNFFLDTAAEHGYTEVMTPYVVHRRILEGTGQLPKFEEDLFRLAAPLNGADAFLIPTAEVPVTNLHREEILEEADLPIQYACFTPCFRAEAGSAGRDVRGIIRQHQFHKVELVWITAEEASEAAHEQLVGHAEACLQRLGLPYRVVLLCGGDISFAAYKCYDIEVWLPSQAKYREISSVSNFRDFQARRMQLRYRPAPTGPKKARPKLAHTLNGSGLAVGRTLVAILENYQQADGSVLVPDVLQPYMGGLTRLDVDDSRRPV